MFDRHYVGRDLFTAANYGLRRPISRITLFVDDENTVTAGDDTGMELIAKCPYATEAMAKALLSSAKGKQYIAYEATAVNLDPAVELGDGVTVDGVYSVIAQITDNGDGYPDIAFPGEDLIEEEYPGIETPEENLDRKLAQTRSLISKNSEQIQLRITNDEAESLIKQTLNDITLSVSSTNGVTSIQLSGDGIDVKAENLNLSVKAANITGTLTANQIDATNLKVAAANITGTLKVSQINMAGSITWDDLDSDVQSEIENAGGLSKSQVKTVINQQLVASPEIHGGVFKDLDEDVSLYLDKTGTYRYGLMLEDDDGEIFSVWNGAQEVASISLKGEEFLSINGRTLYAWGTWDFSNAEVIW